MTMTNTINPNWQTVSEEEQKKMQVSKGERYAFYFAYPWFWSKDNLYVASKIAAKFRDRKPDGYKVLNVTTEGRDVIVWVEITEDSPTVAIVAISIAAVVIAIAVGVSLSKVTKMTESPVGKALGFTALLVPLAALALGGFYLYKRG